MVHVLYIFPAKRNIKLLFQVEFWLSQDLTRAVIGWKSVSYQSANHGAELEPFRHLSIYTVSDHCADFSLPFFFCLIVGEILDQASWLLAAEKPNKGNKTKTQLTLV